MHIFFAELLVLGILIMGATQPQTLHKTLRLAVNIIYKYKYPLYSYTFTMHHKLVLTSNISYALTHKSLNILR